MFTNQSNLTIEDLTRNIQLDIPKTNLSINKKMTNQKFLMHGPKFFDGSLKQLHTEDEAGQLPASALAVHIGLHYIVNDIGLLPSDFTIAQLAITLKLPYTTVYTGFQVLLERKLVQETFVQGVLPVYEISNYALNNRTKQEGNMECVSLSYFRIPHALLETSILQKLVKHRDSKGIYFFLDLCNAFTRKIGTSYQENVNQYALTRRMSFLKDYLHRNAKKVREYADILSPLFQFESVHTDIRYAREGRLTRIRKAVNQILVPKFTIRMAAACVIENNNMDIKQQEAKMRKESVSRLKSIGYALSTKDHRDLVVSFQNEVSQIAYLVENKTARTQLMTYTMCYALDALEQYVKTTGQKVKSIGAFVRTKLRESLPSWSATYLHDHDRHELLVAFTRKEMDIPDWVRMSL
ncbi:hypothetical protein [Bacillus mycoides]|uniref:hypothetical protein n=1 Tax=Bacillus mycoides TaxID=1405 RepID=UPI001C012F25|nr:hypothetical protein [Bacillus mycoides]QWH76087.1 hypothetical protein EXW59_04650 [Bacillus mycoides]QWI47103.1 hypothetical protein EXW55_29960 [Bacillus mycoides]